MNHLEFTTHVDVLDVPLLYCWTDKEHTCSEYQNGCKAKLFFFPVSYKHLILQMTYITPSYIYIYIYINIYICHNMIYPDIQFSNGRTSRVPNQVA